MRPPALSPNWVCGRPKPSSVDHLARAASHRSSRCRGRRARPPRARPSRGARTIIGSTLRIELGRASTCAWRESIATTPARRPCSRAMSKPVRARPSTRMPPISTHPMLRVRREVMLHPDRRWGRPRRAGSRESCGRRLGGWACPARRPRSRGSSRAVGGRAGSLRDRPAALGAVPRERGDEGRLGVTPRDVRPPDRRGGRAGRRASVTPGLDRLLARDQTCWWDHECRWPSNACRHRSPRGHPRLHLGSDGACGWAGWRWRACRLAS